MAIAQMVGKIQHAAHLLLANDRAIADPSDVKFCMFTECRKDGVFGHCMNKAGNACSGGKWYKCVFSISQSYLLSWH